MNFVQPNLKILLIGRGLRAVDQMLHTFEMISAEVLFAFAVAWLWLGEALDALQLTGAVIVLVAIVLAQTARAGGAVDADLASQPMARRDTLA